MNARGVDQLTIGRSVVLLSSEPRIFTAKCFIIKEPLNSRLQ
jgi:hypothetical protein